MLSVSVRFNQILLTHLKLFLVLIIKMRMRIYVLYACGPMVAEAMRAAWILKQEYNLETRIINIHTIKPIDKDNSDKGCG